MRAGVAAVPADRRDSARTRTECPAQLDLTSGTRFGLLWDLSETGARVQLDDPPRVGAEALVKWHAHEALCRVIWSRDDMCGVAFFRALAPAMLDETLQEEARRAGPAASVSNIPLGQKRRRF